MLASLWPPQGAAWIAWAWLLWAALGLAWWWPRRHRPQAASWAMALVGFPCLSYLLALGLVQWDPTWEDNGAVEAIGWPERWAWAFLLALPIWVLATPLFSLAWLLWKRLTPGPQALGDRPKPPPEGPPKGLA